MYLNISISNTYAGSTYQLIFVLVVSNFYGEYYSTLILNMLILIGNLVVAINFGNGGGAGAPKYFLS